MLVVLHQLVLEYLWRPVVLGRVVLGSLIEELVYVGGVVLPVMQSPLLLILLRGLEDMQLPNTTSTI